MQTAFQRPDPIVSAYVDTETGIEYTYTANAPILPGDYEILPEKSAKDIVVAFLWQVLVLDLHIKGHPDLKQQVIDILPLVVSLFETITVDFEETSNDPHYTYTLIPYSIAPFVDVNDTANYQKHLPSLTFADTIMTKVHESKALSVALTVYLDITGKRAENSGSERAEAVDDKSSGTQLSFQTGEGNMSLGLHFISQLLHIPRKFEPEDLEQWQEFTGQPITRKITQYGIDLTEIQLRVVEALSEALSKNRGRGNLPPLAKDEILSDLPGINEIESLPRLYRNVHEIPRLKLGKRELVRLAGMNDSAQSDTERVVQAIEFLSTTQFCFYYTRLALDENNKPILDSRTKKYKKEEVTAVDTLVKVKTIQDEMTREFSYYEITMSALFLDQKSTYFLLVPFGWREEVRSIVGNKKSSSYLHLFLLYLRYQFEQKRQKNASPQQKTKVKYTIDRPWVEIAQAIRMPETVYRRNKSRALSILEDAYSAAKTLGYLSDYTHQGDKDILVLNPDKYVSPKKSLESGPSQE